MDTYLTQIKSIADQLVLAASPIDDKDLVLLILNGLPDEYNASKTAIRTRVETISIGELCSLLNSESIHVESVSKQALASELPFAYHVSSTSSRGGFRGGSYRGRGGGRPGSRFFKGTSSSSNATFRGRGRSSISGQGPTGSQSYQSSSTAHSAASHPHSSQVICQICGKLNHSALECWYRLDTSSFHSSRPQTHQAYITNTNQSATGSPGDSSSTTTNWLLILQLLVISQMT
ncbi:uncharacterized protein LOC114295310 [Camellia sinensis]|uniref:uncharacterized protein LOC114295310 n=1 Tax=Camellia sinensis TaxID=4442 RepID=UPI001036A177|nr:uncharacterized protein LOC114295310 [Camellia sinensis]